MKYMLATVALTCAVSIAPAFGAPLPRSNVVLSSATAVDLAANTVTLPLHKGTARGATVWYIVTDASDPAAAAKLHVNYSPALANATAAAVATASGTIDQLAYPGTVDFTPARELKTDAHGNPTAAAPGSVGDADYSPIVRIGTSGPIYNAPIVASGDAPHDVAGHSDVLDRVVAIDTHDAATATVTLVLARGFTNGRAIAYISTDASADGPAAIERSTYAPKLKALKSGTIPIDVLFNGTKQGIPFAALHGHLASDASAENAATLGSPLNVQATFPAANNAPSGYSPLWDVYAGVWTKTAIAGKETLLKSTGAFAAAADAKWITAPDGKPFGPAGIVVNCPVVAFADARP
jgi:hypothetical protein